MAEPSENPVESLGDFVSRVRDYREFWGNEDNQELWFRGEGRDYEKTKLRPELYRPADGKSLIPVGELLGIEDDLYEEFRRFALERCGFASRNAVDWAWDSYFLMQHHEGPTRLLDWSDGALMALHFATRNRFSDGQDSYVFVLEPYRFMDKTKALPDRKVIEDSWKAYVAKPSADFSDEDGWDIVYLPGYAESTGVDLPRPPLLLEFPYKTRRFAAQRSRFIVFGSEPRWLADELEASDSCIKRIAIAGSSRRRIRQELRDCGVTESVIYPDLDGLGRETRQLWEDRKS
jgi:hypothetical protein